MIAQVQNEQEPKYGGFKVQLLFGNSEYTSLTGADDRGLSEVES